jgi:hypothetical protein
MQERRRLPNTFFVRKEPLHNAEALFISINAIAGHTMKQRLFQMEIIK